MSFIEVTLSLLEGFGNTLFLFFITLVLSLPLGLLVSFCSMSKLSFTVKVKGKAKEIRPIALLTKTFIWIVRGTPLMLQVIAVFFLPGLLFDMPMRNRMLAVCIAFVINYSAYFSEIYRGGIEGISKGQYEACHVLGMNNVQIFRYVVLPQVIKRILAPMGNEIITLVKDTSLARVISVTEIVIKAQSITANYGVIYPIFYTGAFYLIFVGVLTILFSKLEKKLSYYN